MMNKQPHEKLAVKNIVYVFCFLYNIQIMMEIIINGVTLEF